MKTAKTIRNACALTVALMIGSAHGEDREVQYSADVKSAVDFGRSIIGPLSGGLGKWLGRLNNSERETSDTKIFEARFIPVAGDQSVFKSFANYCQGIGGAFEQNLCSDREKRNLYFYVALVPAPPPAQSSVDLTVYESKTPPGKQLMSIAEDHGYRSTLDATTIDFALLQRVSRAQAAEKKAEMLRQQEIEAAAQRERELQANERRSKVAQRARGNVFERGMRICMVNESSADNLNFSVDDFNRNNGRIRIVGVSEPFWSDAQNWFPCAALGQN